VFKFDRGLLFVVDQFALFKFGRVLDTDRGVLVDIGLEQLDGNTLDGRFGLFGQDTHALLLLRFGLAGVFDALFESTEVAFFEFVDQRLGLQQ